MTETSEEEYCSSFVMPPEWHPHESTWLAWPFNRDTWPTNLQSAQLEYIELIRALIESEPVNLIVPKHQLESFKVCVDDRFSIETDELQIHPFETNDAWIRDYGPTFTTNGTELAAVDWVYNAWGGKYPPFDDDAKITTQIIESLQRSRPNVKVRRLQSPLCFEGGAIEVDESRTLVTTLSCALNPNRNPSWDLEAIETELQRCLGVEKIVWFEGNGIIGDDTDGHIDQLIRFAPGNRVLYAEASDSDDPQYDPLAKNQIELHRQFPLLNSQWQHIALPLPNAVVFNRVQIPASYCNFYITNQSVIVPQFGDSKSDDRALQILRDQFPGRKILGLPSNHLTVGLGSFHCLTQQQPKIAACSSKI